MRLKKTKMKAQIKILVCSLWAMLAIMPAWARRADDNRLVKEISRQFEVKPGVTIDLTNKYGQIVMGSWDKDSVDVKIRITAYGRNDDAVEKMMDRVDFDFSNTYSFLTIETVFDRNKGFFRDLINSVSDVSNSLINTSRINVDYEIMVPENAIVELQNRFGDIYINQHAGKLEIDLSHGDFKASRLEGYTDIRLSYGNAIIRNMQDGRVTLTGADLDLSKGSSVFVESSSSEIYIADASTLRMDSRNDRIKVDVASVFSIDGNFSNITLGNVYEKLDADMVYGDLFCHQVATGFQSIRVAASSGNIDVNFDPLSDHDILISAPADRMVLPDLYDQIERKTDPANSKNTLIRGRVGENNAGRMVDIKVDNGGLTISRKDVIPYSVKENEQ